ncbi:MAG TPA: TetR/AcrR family transcriptional regulator [Algoriphagus sp.]|nr:TetR/AcrR family transcriptional regulator [Algoriphagus sp.]
MKTTPKLKTKEKIICTAVKLFNESGIQNITSRHIAAELGISHGNLDYHYKTKEELLLGIYEKMRNEITTTYTIRGESVSSLEHFHRLLVELEDFQYRYRFFNLDVLEISRTFPLVKQILQETFDKRRSQTKILFEEFISGGFAAFPDKDALERTLHLIRMVITFWLSQCEILSTYQYTNRGEMVNSIWMILRPYLTEAGIEESMRIQQPATAIPTDK